MYMCRKVIWALLGKQRQIVMTILKRDIYRHIGLSFTVLDTNWRAGIWTDTFGAVAVYWQQRASENAIKYALHYRYIKSISKVQLGSWKQQAKIHVISSA